MKFNPDKHHRRSIRLKGYDYSRPITPALPIIPAFKMRPKSLSSLMVGFQSSVTSKINQLRGTYGLPVWQRNYFDRIIRDGEGAKAFIPMI